nr:4Fe-4S dicluster domain-containing protein [Desulfocapsaceae bacterium]
DGFYDAVLVAVNFRSPQKLFVIIEQAAAAGVGIIAMKTQNGGYEDSAWPEYTPHQAALRFVLEKPGIHLAVPGMLSRNMIDENCGAVNKEGDLADYLNLESYKKALTGKACAFCSQCVEQCLFQTGGLDAVRVTMYAEGYGDYDLASSNAVKTRANISRCLTCAGCVVQCSQGIDIKAAAKKASLFLT